jgi:hypothetical protein
MQNGAHEPVSGSLRGLQGARTKVRWVQLICAAAAALLVVACRDSEPPLPRAWSPPHTYGVPTAWQTEQLEAVLDGVLRFQIQRQAIPKVGDVTGPIRVIFRRRDTSGEAIPPPYKYYEPSEAFVRRFSGSGVRLLPLVDPANIDPGSGVAVELGPVDWTGDRNPRVEGTLHLAGATQSFLYTLVERENAWTVTDVR